MINNQYIYDLYNYYGYLPCTNYNIYTNFNSDYRNIKSSTATAIIKGGPFAPNIKGYMHFTDVPYGTNVCVKVTGLPEYKKAEGNKSPIGPHGFHIHEFGNCEVGDKNDPFKSVGGHWNPYNQPHGNHAGDFPVLFSNHGIANMCFFTDKFKVKDIIGKSIIIHENPDDYRTEPSGNSGRKLACGEIIG
ncbi:Cu-Zn family superoxide dismutase [Clostridium algidicarnis DSM 15099]|uniref:Cu-Zn family superoxide dismutase n=2 Tax=Clostridium algidicarnis TaxID=37659 RepID=A0A2S6FVD4_9CLOT|nr:Cu-Zn family superoxide dismutase [Clostridium algidicarnis DSM 15099]